MKNYLEIRRLSPHEKEIVLERDSHLCGYCLEPAECVDHIIPFSYSRNDDPSNLVACCNECNLIASNEVFSSFEDKREYILKKKYHKKSHSEIMPSLCRGCGSRFTPHSNGSSLFYCADCYSRGAYPQYSTDKKGRLVISIEIDEEMAQCLRRAFIASSYKNMSDFIGYLIQLGLAEAERRGYERN